MSNRPIVIRLANTQSLDWTGCSYLLPQSPDFIPEKETLELPKLYSGHQAAYWANTARPTAEAKPRTTAKGDRDVVLPLCSAKACAWQVEDRHRKTSLKKRRLKAKRNANPGKAWQGLDTVFSPKSFLHVEFLDR